MPANPHNVKQHEVGELRQDITTGKWVTVATGRAKRPHDFVGEAQKKVWPKYKADCPFCNLAEYPQEPDVIRMPDDPERWQVHIFPNKYPAFSPDEDFRAWKVGPYSVLETVGYHTVLATRWHNQLDATAAPADLALQIEALVLHYRQLRQKESVNYIQIIKNHGLKAGGSLEHPHHQIFTVPVLPDEIQDMLYGAERYARTHGTDPFTVMLDYEREVGERIVWENDHFTALCPFASRVPFEIWIVPREPQPYFETMGPAERDALGEAMHQVFGRLYTGLSDPPYNYFIHSAPCDDKGFVCDTATFRHFRWHLEIMPRLSTWGGFELATGLEITTALPEESAKFLREQELPGPR